MPDSKPRPVPLPEAGEKFGFAQRSRRHQRLSREAPAAIPYELRADLFELLKHSQSS
jgi:hypothetical protein